MSSKEVLLALVTLSWVTPATAQLVRGTVTESESNSAMRGTFVVLLDSAGSMRGSALTDENGRYALRAPFAGSFRIRAEQIGHQTKTSATLTLAADNTMTVDLALPVAAIELEAISAEGVRRCVARPQMALQAAKLWDEARKALNVTSWSEKENRIQLDTRTYSRLLDQYTLAITGEQIRPAINMTRAYAAIPVDTLTRYGFVRPMGGDTIAYYGPDADVLLSESFLDTHCFHVEKGTGATQGMAGLSFEPVPGRKLKDIKGTFWIDAKTSELRYIEYTYTGLDAGRSTGGGRTNFRRLPTGMWIVDHWYIRMPLIAKRQYGDQLLVGYAENGGEIVDVHEPSSKYELAKTRIVGTVYDSTRHTPLRDAIVYLSGTTYRTTTDQSGHFEIADVLEGSYQLAFSYASFDSLPALPSPRTIDARGAVTHADLAIPATQTLIGQVCPGSNATGVITGYVWTAHEGPNPNATVTISWGTVQQPAGVRVTTDLAGRYVVCGVPLNKTVRLQASGARPELASVGSYRMIRKDLQPFE